MSVGWWRRWDIVLSGFMSDTTWWWNATTIIHSRVSQVSQVIIKLLVAKIIIKVLFLPVTPVTAPAQMKIQCTKS
jgi:hypothetical protein